MIVFILMFNGALNKPLFKEAFSMLVVVFILDRIGWFYNLYLYGSPIKEYDSLVHFCGGVTAGLGVLWFYFYSGAFDPRDRKYKNFFIISIISIIFVGFAWEAFELLAGLMKVNMIGYGYDTILDLIFDTLGTVVATIYARDKELKWKPNLHFLEELAAQPEQI